MYLDDIIIYSNSWDEHLHRIRKLFQNLREAGLVVNLGKCEFGKGEVTYLGHKVGHGHVKPKEANVIYFISDGNCLPFRQHPANFRRW